MPAELEALVTKLKAKRKGVRNPFALARYILGSDKQIAAHQRPHRGPFHGHSTKRK